MKMNLIKIHNKLTELSSVSESLNYSDSHTDMMLDFSVNYNKNQIVDFQDINVQSIYDSCKNLWSNKEHRAVNGLNIVSLNYSDSHTDMMLDFSVNYNKNQIVDLIS